MNIEQLEKHHGKVYVTEDVYGLLKSHYGIEDSCVGGLEVIIDETLPPNTIKTLSEKSLERVNQHRKDELDYFLDNIDGLMKGLDWQ